VVEERGDGAQAELAHALEPLVGPAPVRPGDAIRLDPLPQHRVADRGQTQRGEPVEILEPVVVAVQPRLVDDLAADPRHGALDATPHLQRWAIRREPREGGTTHGLARDAASLLECRRWGLGNARAVQTCFCLWTGGRTAPPTCVEGHPVEASWLWSS
jgi:hypothetical protein